MDAYSICARERYLHSWAEISYYLVSICQELDEILAIRYLIPVIATTALESELDLVRMKGKEKCFPLELALSVFKVKQLNIIAVCFTWSSITKQ